MAGTNYNGLSAFMAVARETRALVMVHAENYDVIRFLTEQLEQAGRTAPRFHATSRPVIAEREATYRAISLAELSDVPLMVVHVSNREAMEEIRRARQRGQKIAGETCPQYLMLTADDLDVEGIGGAPDEADAPLIVDADAVLASTIALERLEPIAGRNAEVGEGVGRIEDDEFSKRDA